MSQLPPMVCYLEFIIGSVHLFSVLIILHLPVWIERPTVLDTTFRHSVFICIWHRKYATSIISSAKSKLFNVCHGLHRMPFCFPFVACWYFINQSIARITVPLSPIEIGPEVVFHEKLTICITIRRFSKVYCFHPKPIIFPHFSQRFTTILSEAFA